MPFLISSEPVQSHSTLLDAVSPNSILLDANWCLFYRMGLLFPVRSHSISLDGLIRYRSMVPFDIARHRSIPCCSLSISLDSIRFHSIPFDPGRWYSTPFDPIQSRSILLDSIWSQSVPFNPIRSNSISFDVRFRFCSIPFNLVRCFSIPFDPIQPRLMPFYPFFLIPFHPIRSHSIPFDPIWSHMQAESLPQPWSSSADQHRRSTRP